MIFLACERSTQIHILMSSLHALTRGIRNGIMRQVACIRIRAAQQSTGGLHQVGYMHIGCERIASRPCHITTDKDACWRNLVRLTMHQDAVPRLDQDIV